jgi:penicillin-binding protein 2
MVGDSQRVRLSILGIVGLSMFAALFARLWYLQVIGTEEYQLAAAVQNTREVATEAPRGRILDAKGRVIVDNRISVIVTIDPARLTDFQEDEGRDARDALLLRLSEALTERGHPIKVADLEDRLVDPRYNPVEPRPVAVDVDEELEVFLLERHREFPAIDVRREAVRVYPYGSLAAHVLGYVGRINEDEYVEQMGTDEAPVDNLKPYEPDDSIGKTGVERVYEEHLRGTPGVRVIEVDARGEPIRTIDYTPPVPGNDIQLTIDLDVQALSEDALRLGLEEARARRPRGNNPAHQAPAGSIVVEDPTNGAIVALASYPTYDPSEFVGGISTARYDELLGDESTDDPFTNRALAGQYAPGSTFKLITAYAAMRDGLITANSSYYDRTSYTAIGCQAGSQCTFGSPDGALARSYAVESALTASSDSFFYWLGDRYWVEEGRNRTGIQDAAEEYGLHEPTGVPLPFEQGGYIPTPERRQQRHDENPEAFPFPEWYSGDNIITAIGQGDVLVTPMQLANAYASFANHGTVHEPNIAARILEPGGDPNDPADVIRTFEPRVARQVDLPPEIWDPMHRGFVGVTSVAGGTARAAFGDWDHAAWPVAGKTGTAQVDGKADTALFAGYGPANAEPRYAIAVILEEAGFGGEAAAPVARWVLEPLSGQAELPAAETVEQQTAGPAPECVVTEEEPEPEIGEDGLVESTTTTSTTVPRNPLLAPQCPDEEPEPDAGGVLVDPIPQGEAVD